VVSFIVWLFAYQRQLATARHYCLVSGDTSQLGECYETRRKAIEYVVVELFQELDSP
jgi:hypothetical protein